MLKAKKFWVALAVVAMTVMALPVQPLTADAACDSQAGCQALVTQLENEAKELDNQLAQISNDDKASLEEKMNLVNGYLRNIATTSDEVEANISALTNKSETLKAEAIVIRDKVATRMVHMQELSKGNILLDFLVNSESLSDFIQRAMTLTDLTTYDQQMLNQMQTKLTEIETNQAVIAESQKTIDSLYTTAQSKLTELETIETELVAQLEKEAATLVAQNQTVPAESSHIVEVPDGVFTHPLPGGYLMFPWGVCGDDYFGKCHTGTDFGAYVGAPVIASASGVVTAAGTDGSRGNYVTISHDGATTQYYHLDSITVSAGQSVIGGQMIGTMGATGFVTAPHLHFELWMNGVNVDPGIYVGY